MARTLNIPRFMLTRCCCLALVMAGAGSICADDASLLQVHGPGKWLVKRVPYKCHIPREPGGRASKRWWEFPGNRVRYSIDDNDPVLDRLSSFNLGDGDDGHLVVGRKTHWHLAMSAENGEHLSLVGQIYRWDGRRRMLIQVRDHPLTMPQEDGMRRFVIHGPQATLNLSGDGSLPYPYLQITLLELQPAKPGKTPGRVQLSISVYRDTFLHPSGELVLPTKTNRVSDAEADQSKYWMSEGEQIWTNSWDLTLKRIIYPDPERGIRGWADFYLEPEPQDPPEKK